MRACFALLAGAAALLAGCGDSGGADADGDGEITAEEVAAEAANGGDITMRAGSWKQTVSFTELNVPGMPENVKDMLKSQMASGFTSTQCLSEEDVAEPGEDVFMGEGEQDCKYDTFDRSGNRMTLRMTCSTGDGGTAKVAMDGAFAGETYEMKIENVISGTPMGDVTMKGTITGERVGDC